MIGQRGLAALSVGIAVTAVAGIATAAAGSHPAAHPARACETAGHVLALRVDGHCPSGTHPVALGARGSRGPAGPSESYSFVQDKSIDLFTIATPTNNPAAHPVAVLKMSRLVPGVYQVSGKAFFTLTSSSDTDAAEFDCVSTKSGLTFDVPVSAGRPGTLNTVARDAEITIIPAASAGRDVLKCAVTVTPHVTGATLHDLVITAVRMADETKGP
jgi:hypothetical protein